MIEYLAKRFIKDSDNVKSSAVRQAYGVLCGIVGIVFNVLLFVIKLVAGILSGSVAITADAINNLSDAGSSLILMVGFKMAGKKPDADHPFGHGRIEYITGLIVSMLIILLGFELIQSSFSQIIHPQAVSFDMVVLAILIFSVLIKLYMYRYNTITSKKIESTAMKAVSSDCLTDAVATSVALISMLIGYFTGLKIDGFVGMLISAFVLYAGISSAKDTIDPLLGSRPDPEFIKQIEKYALSNEGILGIHDLVVHDYGPGRMMISFHVEVSSCGDILELHDTIDNMEKKLRETLGCYAVIHLDPIVVDNGIVDRMRRLTTLVVKSIDEQLSIHDFRMVKGPTHTNLIFDILVPYEINMNDEEVMEKVRTKVEELPGNHYAVITIDHPMV